MCGNVEERQKELPGGEVLPTMGGSTGGSIRGPQVLSGGHQGALPNPRAAGLLSRVGQRGIEVGEAPGRKSWGRGEETGCVPTAFQSVNSGSPKPWMDPS